MLGKTDVSGHTNTTVYEVSSGDEQGDNKIFSSVNADFTADGPFLGLGYGLNLGSGTLSLTGAVAFLDGKSKQTENQIYYGGESRFNILYESKPSATGLALSLAWKAPITKQLAYGIFLDMYKYDFDKKVMNYSATLPTGETFSGETFPLKVKEESVGIKASLSYSF